MEQIERLQKHWQHRVRFSGMHAAMTLEKDALVLGAKTALATRTHDRALALDGEEARILTLLAVASGRPVNPSILGAIRRASKHARAGDECMAAMHIALALPVMRDPLESARRLFIADGLMKDGASPRDIWNALEFDPAPLDELEKLYNPGQPRVPAGSGRTSGQWTSDSDTTGQTRELLQAPARIATDMAAEGATDAAGRAWWQMLLDIGATSAGPLAFLGALLYSTPAGGERREGRVPGNPDLYWTEDEGLFTITRESDGKVVLQATRDANGNFRVKQSRAVGRLLNEHSRVDPATLPPEDPRSSQRRDEPHVCPEPPLPDPQGTGRAKAYADFMKTLVNQPPTPPELGYWLTNPWDNGQVVKYDDCEQKSGTMIEFKAACYVRQFNSEPNLMNITNKWLDQATRQIEASGGRPIRWYFAEERALEYARTLFHSTKYGILNRIELVYMPMPEGDQ
jgi:hypothetical protein